MEPIKPNTHFLGREKCGNIARISPPHRHPRIPRVAIDGSLQGKLKDLSAAVPEKGIVVREENKFTSGDAAMPGDVPPTLQNNPDQNQSKG